MRFLKYILSVSFLLSSVLLHAQEENATVGGLLLQYHDNPSLRTSYTVFDTPQKLPQDSLCIRFKASLQRESRGLGHILTCTSGEKEFFNIILKRIDAEKKQLFFNLNLKVFKNQLVVAVDEEKIQENWFDFILKFDFIRNEASLTIGDTTKKISFTGNKEAQGKKFNYVFGRCGHYLDVYPFAIKDLTFQFDKTHWKFPMNEISGNLVHNKTGKQTGHVQNPFWLYNTHMKWEEEAIWDENEIAAVYHDADQDRLVIYTSDTLYTYDIKNRIILKKAQSAVQEKMDSKGGCNYLFNPKNRNLVMYNKTYDPNQSDHLIKVYNYDQGQIIATGRESAGDRYHQASVFMDQHNNDLYEFGGYSSFLYNKDFRKLDLNRMTWQKVQFTGDEIYPRFYTASANDFRGDKNIAYIYGGYGNPVGNQDFGGEYYHDLYRIDLEKHEVQKLANFDLPDFEQVPCRDMILGKDGHSFYTFCYPQYLVESHLQLYRFDWKKRSVLPLAEPISFISEQIMTQISLFENPHYECMLCVIQEFINEGQSKIKIYRINEPILPFKEMTTKQEEKTPVLLYIILTLLIGGSLAATLYFFLKKRKKATGPTVSVQAANEIAEEITIPVDEDALQEINQPQPTITEVIKNNSIYLLGEFTVFDRSGKDITYLFSAKIRQLFLLIFMHTYRSSSQGIASKEISFIMWPEKELAESKNIRGVTIKYLRDALSDVDGIEVVSTGGKWYINIDKEICHCDYLSLLDADIRDIDNYDDMRPYVHMLRRGGLLKAENYEWLDSFKAEYEEVILQKLNEKMYSSFETAQYLISYKISQVLLNIVPLNEEVMKIEVNSLIKLGDPVKAKVKFRQFSVNYYEAYGENLQYEDYVM